MNKYECGFEYSYLWQPNSNNCVALRNRRLNEFAKCEFHKLVSGTEWEMPYGLARYRGRKL